MRQHLGTTTIAKSAENVDHYQIDCTKQYPFGELCCLITESRLKERQVIMSVGRRETRGEFFKRRSFCIVTGASRGLGKEIAIQLVREWEKEGIPVHSIPHFFSVQCIPTVEACNHIILLK